MNKKFLVVALMAALSTVGFAYELPHLDAGATDNSGKIGVTKGNENFNSLAGAVDTLEKFQEVTSQQVGELVNKTDELEGKVNEQGNKLDSLDGKVDNIENELAGKVSQEDFNSLKDQANGNSQALGELGKDIVALGKENDKQNDRLDATEDRLDLGDRIDGVQNQQIGALQTENVEQNNRLDKVEKENGKQNAAIEANKNQIEQNRQDIAKGDQINKVQNQQIGALQTENVEQNNRLDKVEKENDKQNGRLDKVEGKNKEQDKTIAQNKQDIADLRNDYTQVNGRLSGLEKKVDNLDDKMNKGLSLMAAMNAVDFQNVQTGEMAIGAGIGHYGNAQSVALGVAYAPVEDLTVNAKYSITAGDPDSFAVGAGATYKFKVGR